jgi:hypothetical protein
MRRKNGIFLVLAVAICSLFFLSGISDDNVHAKKVKKNWAGHWGGVSDDNGHAKKVKNDWAGHWGCSFSLTEPSHLATVSQMTIDANGDVTGTIKTAALPHLIIDCDTVGTQVEIRDHYAEIETQSICRGQGFPDIEVYGLLECVGLGKGENGYTEMFCIDLVDEQIPGTEQVALVHCKRSDLK